MSNSEELRTSVRTRMIRYSVDFGWLARQIGKWEADETDKKSLQMAVSGTRMTGRYAKLVEESDRVLTRYGEMYGDVQPA